MTWNKIVVNNIKRYLIIFGAFYLRHSPIEKGRFRITSVLLPWLRLLGSGMGTRIIRTRYKFFFFAELADWLGQYVYMTGTYEPPTSEMFVDLIKPGDTVLDVGANVGYFSLLAAKLTGPSGRVFAFEPIPTVRNRLIENITFNEFSNIQIVPKAVSDFAAKLTIYEGPEGHKGISSLRPLAGSSQKLIIDSIALDDMAEELARVDLVKIDVEGAEMRVLVGMEKLIEKDHPSLIIEFTDEYLRSFGHSVAKMADWLVVRGYKLYRIEEGGMIDFNHSEEDLPAQYNILATQPLSKCSSQEY